MFEETYFCIVVLNYFYCRFTSEEFHEILGTANKIINMKLRILRTCARF